MTARRLLLGLALVLLGPATTFAQGKAKLAREAAEYLLRTFGKEAADVGVETLTRKIEALALRHGDEAVLAVRKVGPRTFHLVEGAGQHGSQSVKLLARCGDDAIRVVGTRNRLAIFVRYGDPAADAMIKHGEIAEPLLEALGEPAAGALVAVTTQNGRRLAMMAKDGKLGRIGRTHEVLAVVAKYGDRAMNFIWQNRASLQGMKILTAFLADPEPFLNGAIDNTYAAPATAAKSNTASQPGPRTNSLAVALGGVLVAGLIVSAMIWFWFKSHSGKRRSPT